MIILPGNKTPVAIYRGNRPITGIFVGSKLVWPEAYDYGIKSMGICKTHAAFVLNDGTFWTMGSNLHGQLCRLGSSGSWKTPNLEQVPDITDARAVVVSNTSAGEGSTVLLREYGRLYSGGFSNSASISVTATKKRAYTSLGRESQSGSPAFSNFSEVLGIHSIERIWHGRGQLIVQQKNGPIYGFGLDWDTNRGLLRWMPVDNSYGEPLECSDLSIQAENFAALGKDGTLAMHGPLASWYRPPGFPLSALVQPYADEHFLAGIQKVKTGLSHLAARTKAGYLHTAGSDAFGQLCSFRFQYANPEKGRTIDDEKISDVACGDYHTVVLTANGHVKTGGLNNRGQLGRTVPVGNGHDWMYYTGTDRVAVDGWFGNYGEIPEIDDALAVYAGGDSTFIVRKSGFLVCGDNEFGQLGVVCETHVVNGEDRAEWAGHVLPQRPPFRTNLKPAKLFE